MGKGGGGGGGRQGGLESPYLFFLAAEILAEMIRLNGKECENPSMS